ncbi:hypothetical protein RSAG8_08360, partial [Rhizoctonia solani AG-8 WAC10335]
VLVTSYHHGGTRVTSAPRAQTSPSPPQQSKCIILATYGNGTAYGYIRPVWSDFGKYCAFQPSQRGALEVSFSCWLSHSARLHRYQLARAKPIPFLEEHHIESAIWAYNPSTYAIIITAHWSSSEGSTPPTAITYIYAQGVLALTGGPGGPGGYPGHRSILLPPSFTSYRTLFPRLHW